MTIFIILLCKINLQQWPEHRAESLGPIMHWTPHKPPLNVAAAHRG